MGEYVGNQPAAFFVKAGLTGSWRFAGLVGNQDRKMEISAWVQRRDTYNQKSEAEGLCMTILCGSSLVASLFTSPTIENLGIKNLGIKNDSIDGHFVFCAMNRTVSLLFMQSISQKTIVLRS